MCSSLTKFTVTTTRIVCVNFTLLHEELLLHITALILTAYKLRKILPDFLCKFLHSWFDVCYVWRLSLNKMYISTTKFTQQQVPIILHYVLLNKYRQKANLWNTDIQNSHRCFGIDAVLLNKNPWMLLGVDAKVTLLFHNM